MRYVNREDLPVEILEKELPKVDGKTYKMFYDEDKRTNGGFTSVLFLAGIMGVVVMWGIIAMVVFK